ncbi:MAG: EmrB/QacA family drug resistance [Geobacteraceae bacterium]|nr:MAG: EmrB/QacA family drug resistance [Geobacteraceae bacterium]
MSSRELRNRLGFLAMSGGTFMAVLDTQIVAGSLPKIAASIGATIEEASWIQTAYMIAEVIMIPLAGWLSRSLSLRYLYSLAALLFTLTSLLCAMAWSIDSLIVLRICQGICSGILAPLLYQGIYLLLPRQRQAGATLFAVMIISLAPVVGPSLGGWITETWSWRWLFFINLLPGIMVSGAVYGLVRDREPEWGLLKRFDFPGIALVALFLGSLEYVLGEGPDREWFDSRLIVCFAVVSAISALLLVWRELSCSHPVVNLRTFRERNFSVGCLFNFVMGLGLFGSGYLMTLFLGGVKRYDSLEIGRVMAVPGIAMLLSVPIARIVRRHVGGTASLVMGLGMFCYALWLNSSMTAETGFDELFLPQVLRGMGIIFCLSPITEIALGQLPVEAVPNATGLYSLMRSLGGGIGIALINILVEQRVWLHYRRLAESLNPARFSEYMEQLRDSFGGRMADLEQAGQGGVKVLAGLVRRESLVMAYNDVWLLVAMLFGVMLVLVPVVRKAERRQ